jgi:hypothetical protein
MFDKSMTDAHRDIVFTRQEARRGVAWLQESYGLFRRARLRWLLMVLAYYFVLVLIKLVPFAGWAAVILKPVFAVGFLAAAWNQERAVPPSPRHLFQGFRSNLWALLPLGSCCSRASRWRSARRRWSTAAPGHLLLDPAPADLDETRRTALRGDARGAARAARHAVRRGVRAAHDPRAVVGAGAGRVPGCERRHARCARACARALANWRPLLRYAIAVFFFAAVVPSFLSLLIALSCRSRSSLSRRCARALHACLVRDAADLGLRELPRRLPRGENARADRARRQPA